MRDFGHIKKNPGLKSDRDWVIIAQLSFVIRFEWMLGNCQGRWYLFFQLYRILFQFI